MYIKKYIYLNYVDISLYILMCLYIANLHLQGLQVLGGRWNDKHPVLTFSWDSRIFDTCHEKLYFTISIMIYYIYIMIINYKL